MYLLMELLILSPKSIIKAFRLALCQITLKKMRIAVCALLACSISDGNMVKEAKCSYKPFYPNKTNKNTHKRPHLVEEVTVEEREERDEVQYGNDLDDIIGDQEV